MTDEKKEVMIMPEQQSVELMITKAIDKGLPVESLERLLAMRRELKAEFAKLAFDESMSAFQSECPIIKKTKEGGKTNSGQVGYYYAPLESIVDQTKEFITKHGFSFAIQAFIDGKQIKVTCIVKHKLGHSEASTMEVPLGTRTSLMSEPQVVAATTTFAKRYAFCNAFGIMTMDDDNDAQAGRGEVRRNPILPPRPPVKPYVRPAAAVKPASQVAPASNVMHNCKRCEEKLDKIIEIPAPVANFSLKVYGMPLCRDCQKIAEKFKQDAAIRKEGK